MKLYELELNKDICNKHEMVELTCRLDIQAQNPFDYDELNLIAKVKKPSGNYVEIPGFYYQPFTRKNDNKRQILIPSETPEWKIRFTPDEEGEYIIDVTASYNQTTQKSKQKKLFVKPSNNAGFLQVGKNNMYFMFDNGQPFFPVGLNVCWCPLQNPRRTYVYDDWYGKLAENGGNISRLWLSPWAFGLEDKECGLGNYKNKMDKAWELDYILNLSASKGIYNIIAINYDAEFRAKNDGWWHESPYNFKNGGPCKKPRDFFTDETAKSFFKQKLKYILARWAYSTNIFAWELWNEVEKVDSFSQIKVIDWHEEMIDFIKANDPNKHLISTSFANPKVGKKMWALESIDFVQIHNYGWPVKNVASNVNMWCREFQNYNKPVLFSEFGIDSEGYENFNDLKGNHIHEGIWSSIMSGSAGTAMSWWWDTYIDIYNLWHLYRGASQFVNDIPWSTEKWNYINCRVKTTPNQQKDIASNKLTVPVVKLASQLYGYAKKLLKKSPAVFFTNLKTTIVLFTKHLSRKRSNPSAKSVMGLQSNRWLIFWIKEAANLAEIEILDVSAGNYAVEWRDTYNNEIIRKDKINVKENMLLKLPLQRKSLACKAQFIS